MPGFAHFLYFLLTSHINDPCGDDREEGLDYSSENDAAADGRDKAAELLRTSLRAAVVAAAGKESTYGCYQAGLDIVNGMKPDDKNRVLFDDSDRKSTCVFMMRAAYDLAAMLDECCTASQRRISVGDVDARDLLIVMMAAALTDRDMVLSDDAQVKGSTEDTFLVSSQTLSRSIQSTVDKVFAGGGGAVSVSSCSISKGISSGRGTCAEEEEEVAGESAAAMFDLLHIGDLAKKAVNSTSSVIIEGSASAGGSDASAGGRWSFEQLLREVFMFRERIDMETRGVLTASTVSSHSFHGLFMGVLLPAVSGMYLIRTRVKDLSAHGQHEDIRHMLVTSPAFLNDVDMDDDAPDLALTVSSGKGLDVDLAADVHDWSQAPVLDVLVNNMAGIVAIRENPESRKDFKAFAGISITSEGSRSTVRCSMHEGEITLSENLEFIAPGRFVIS